MTRNTINALAFMVGAIIALAMANCAHGAERPRAPGIGSRIERPARPPARDPMPTGRVVAAKRREESK